MPEETNKTPLILTRPEEAAADFVRQMPKGLKAFLQVVYTPSLKFELLQNNDINFLLEHKKYDALMFSSGYGVRAFYDIVAGRNDLPHIIFSIGDDTAKQYAFYSHSYQGHHFTADGDMASLLDKISMHNKRYKVLYPCARDLSANTIPLIEKSGLNIDTTPIYQMVKVGSLGFGSVLSDIKNKAIVPFFSVRSAQIFARVLEETGNQSCVKNFIAVCISHNVQKQIAHLPWCDMVACMHAGRSDMYAAIELACASIQ